MAVLRRGLFGFLGKFVFSVREKFVRNIIRPHNTPPPLPIGSTRRVFQKPSEQVVIPPQPEKPNIVQWLEQFKKKPGIETDIDKEQGEGSLVPPEEEGAISGETAPVAPRRVVTIKSADDGGWKVEDGKQKKDLANEFLLLYRRQSVLADIKDSLLSAIPFWPQGKREKTEGLLRASLEERVQKDPGFVKTEEYRLLSESIKPAAEAVLQETKSSPAEMRIITQKEVDQGKEHVWSFNNVLRLQTDIRNGVIRVVHEPFVRFASRVSPTISRGVAQGVGSIAKNIVSSGGLGVRSLAGGIFRGGGQLAVRGLLGLGQFISGVSAGAAIGISGGWLVAIIILVIVGSLVFMMFLVGPAIGPFAVPGRGGAVIPSGNQYISIEKVVTPTVLKNEDLPAKASYIIRVKPRKGELTSVEIKDTVVASSKSGTRTLTEKSWSEGGVAGEKTFEYSLDLGSDLADSVVSNTVTVSFNALGQPARQTDSVNQALRIGNPPEECPSGWPTDYGSITQGANSGFTHKGYEAIDIGNIGGKRIVGATIRASHRGRVSTNCGSSLYGICATITTTCEGKQVTSLYAHMLSSSVRDGQEVTRGMEIGKVGATGNVFGADPNHLHYEFRNNVLRIIPPYVPVFPVVGVSW